MAKAISGRRTRSKAKQRQEMEFDFIKSNSFRVIHADGAFGGIAPTGNIHMALYSERHPIPTKMVHKIEGATLGPEILEKREERPAFVREVDVNVVLNLNSARNLRDWLTSKIETLETITIPTDQPSPATPKASRLSKRKAQKK